MQTKLKNYFLNELFLFKTSEYPPLPCFNHLATLATVAELKPVSSSISRYGTPWDNIFAACQRLPKSNISGSVIKSLKNTITSFWVLRLKKASPKALVLLLIHFSFLSISKIKPQNQLKTNTAPQKAKVRH